MHNRPRQILAALIAQYGSALSADPRRTEAFLRDLCGQHKTEIFVLIQAQRQRIPAELLGAPHWMPRQALQTHLSRHLQQQLALTPAAADWAVAAWDAALAEAPTPHGAKLPVQTGVRTNWVWLSRRIGVQWESGTAAARAAVSSWWSRWPESLQAIAAGLARLAQRTRLPAALLIGGLGLLLLLSSLQRCCDLLPVALVDWLTPTALPVRQLRQSYPPPRPAWIGAGPLNVRSAPSTGAAVLATLAAGQELRVVDYSADGAWSRITAPVAGWVSNGFVHFSSQRLPQTGVVLAAFRGRVTSDVTAVHTGPDAHASSLGSLARGATVVSVARTADGQWLEVTLPVAGWLPRAVVEPVP